MKKTKTIHYRITDVEQKKLFEYASQINVPVSQFIRQVVNDSIKKRKGITGQETAKKQHNCALCEQD